VEKLSFWMFFHSLAQIGAPLTNEM